MNTSSTCPDFTLLREFLDGCDPIRSSETWSRDQIERHVSDCPVCQASLEQLVAGKESWEGTAKQLAEIEAIRSQSSTETPALRQLIDQAKDRIHDTVDSEPAMDRDSVSLDFLQPTDATDSLGRLVSYEILEVVGRGGMGVVLKAYDPSLRRIVAIKVMAGHLASSPLARKRFVREARAAAAVSHDHVVAIYSVEENQEPPFLVMQFVSGKTLQDRVMATGPLTLAEILRIGMQTASGLAAAHAQGLVHRDIKPANILLENGVERVKITDFGLARAVDDVGMTQTGLVAGTPQYMAPEQANGESIDVRSDLFSLGSVMYTICTGRPPFRATNMMGLLKRICEETPRPIRELNPEIPEWLDAIIGKLLKKNPDDRYQTAKEVADLLGHWLAHVQRPISVPAPHKEETHVPSVDSQEKKPLTATGPVSTKIAAEPIPDTDLSRREITAPSNTIWRKIWGDYWNSGSFEGHPEKAFELSFTSLTAAGFQLIEKTPSRLRMHGPGLNQIRGNCLAFASEIDVSHQSNSLTLDARLGTLRAIDGLLLGIYAVGVLITLFQAWPLYPLGILIMAMFGVLIGFSIISRRRVAHQSFDAFLRNLLATGQSNVDQLPLKDPALKGRTLRETFAAAFSSPVHPIVLGIWGSFMIPLMDGLSTLSLAGMYWFALAIITLGIVVPLGVILCAWNQKRSTGTWESTVLKGPPRKLFANPLVGFFLVSSSIWLWHASTRGVVVFDIDDRNFTVSLSRSLGNNRFQDLGNYSADFHQLRLTTGNYYWAVKQGLSPINQGEFELKPLGRQVIKVRSPYPIGGADIELLPGRWKLVYQMAGNGIPTQVRSSGGSIDYIDTTRNHLRIASAPVMQSFQSLMGKQAWGNDSATVANPLHYAIEFPGPPSDHRGPKWIDLFLVDNKSQSKTPALHGIFSADQSRLSMLLTSSGSPRPVNWSFDPNQQPAVLQIQFGRADDLTQFQGNWTVLKNDGNVTPRLVEAIEREANLIHFKISGEDLAIELPASITKDLPAEGRQSLISASQEYTLKLDPDPSPKRVTMTHSPEAGLIVVTEGIYRIDGDRLVLTLGRDGKVPRNFNIPADGERIELQRTWSD